MTKVTAPYLIRKRGMIYLQKRVPKALIGHYGKEFIRKSMRTRDRLREAQCPSDMIDQIGGWSTAGVGQGYGEGYLIKSVFIYISKLNLGT